MQKMWYDRDLPGSVISITPYMNTPSGEEIAEWLRENEVDSYVILDDDSDILPEQMQNFVKCSGNKDHYDCVDIGYGLTRKCAEKAIEILNKQTSANTN